MIAIPLTKIWEMLRLDGKRLFSALGEVSRFHQALLLKYDTVPKGAELGMVEEGVMDSVAAAEFIAEFCRGHGFEAAREQATRLGGLLKATKRYTQDGIEWVRCTPDDLHELMQACDRIEVLLDSDVRSLLLLAVERQNQRYWADEASLAQAAENLFPDAVDEVRRASECIALEQNTASVFHSMRALEVAINHLCAVTAITPKNPNWENVLNDLTKQFNHWDATQRPNWKAEQQFYSAAVAHLKACKNAWRNYVMHGHTVYDSVQAKAVFSGVKTFLNELSTPP